MGANRRDWQITVDRYPTVDASVLSGVSVDADGAEPSFGARIASLQAWVRQTPRPSFAAWAVDDDFAYLCVGADGKLWGHLLFDGEVARRDYGLTLSQDTDVEGARLVAEWATSYAPMFTSAEVIAALERNGGAGDGIRQLMRVLDLDLPVSM
jgi:hypothetical protein